ncbi:nucleotide-binding domain-containing protein [Pholiota conissans]|uniref:Nucleotide-binding domain-containing protein n=1 Tax=Pholiota conissans TaxID=109636 RepID=A0A9P5ZC37_9AGAR|nr:nucleotide-binding domain-containing protein [Pholiota conissans]
MFRPAFRPAQRASLAVASLSRPLVPTCRLYTTTPRPPPPSSGFYSKAKVAAKFTGFVCASSIVGIVVVGTGILAHDAFTYSDRHVSRVPLNPLALHPERGGPKNLPIARVLIDDEEDEEAKLLAIKPKLVIVGGGWGAMGVLESLHPGDYHVTLVSTDTYTTFTPLLPSAAVGTVSVRSLIEPIRKIMARLRGHFVQGKAVDLVMSERLVEVETAKGDGSRSSIYIPYDKLVIAVGSSSSTHGVPGLENCFQLKTIGDAQAIRRRIMDNFETASLPTTSQEERKRLLSFVVCGGGPTGVETAAEIYDFCQEDIMNYFPKICREEVSIHVIQSRDHILNTYSEEISKFAEEKFSRDEVDLITSARVAGVTPTHVLYTIRNTDGQTEQRSIPTNFVLWSTGIAMNLFSQRVSNLLPNQVHKKAIEVDSHLRVNGAPLGEVYAIGDCATIETSLVGHFLSLVNEADKDKNGKIDMSEWEYMVTKIKERVPMAEDHLAQVKELFQLYDSDADNSLSLNELFLLLQDVGNQITSLPATAQVASQQGKYLGKKLHKVAHAEGGGKAGAVALDQDISPPFKYLHLGSLAYIGNAAVFDFGKYSFMGGLVAMYAWRSIYWNEQVSARTRALLMIDWIIRGIWGRDLSRI